MPPDPVLWGGVRRPGAGAAAAGAGGAWTAPTAKTVGKTLFSHHGGGDPPGEPSRQPPLDAAAGGPGGDASIYELLICTILGLGLRVNLLRAGSFAHWLISLAALALMFLAEPLWLHLWGWTPAKWVLGLKLRNPLGGSSPCPRHGAGAGRCSPVAMDSTSPSTTCGGAGNASATVGTGRTASGTTGSCGGTPGRTVPCSG